MIQITIEAYTPDPRYDSDLSPGRWRWSVVKGSTTSGVEATVLDAWRQANATVGYATPLLPFYGVSNYNKMEARAQAAEAERDAALADVVAWRGFAGSVAVAVHPNGTGAVIADHLAVDDLPDLLAAVERVVRERTAALAERDSARGERDRLRAVAKTTLSRAHEADSEAARLRDVIAEAASNLPLHPLGAHLTPPEADAEAVRVALLAALRGEA
jgi:hypothetical protein